MIPRTFPSSVASNGSTQMIVYFLPSVSGMTRWVDYIPVKFTTVATAATENTYDQNGYIPVVSISSITGATPFKEYVPVFLDSSAADAEVWKVNITGFIPVGTAGIGGIISSLFTAGEQGWVYDPSDFNRYVQLGQLSTATMFQDAAGTTPVTAMEQPLGLQLDLKNGYPTLGAELVTNGDFSAGSTGWTLGASFSVASNALLINSTAADNAYQVKSNVNLRWYVVEFDVISIASGSVLPRIGGVNGAAVTTVGKVKQVLFSGNLNSFVGVQCTANTVATIDNISVRELPGNHRYQTTSANRPVVSARVNLLTATETLATQTVTTRATTQTLTFTGSGSITLSGTAAGTYTAGTYSVTTTAGSLTLTVSGTVTQADLRATNMGVGLPVYQRVNTSTDYDTAGFPVYIKPNGSNQFMVSNAINFTATDKMTVWAGVRKLSDVSVAMLFELSSTIVGNNGAFVMLPTRSTVGTMAFSSKGSAIAEALTATTYIAPVTNVMTGLADISGDSAILRVNGAQAAINTADQGTGNYGNYPVYHYMRAGISLQFNGHDYGSICRGAASSLSQITAAEDWINQRTKAY